MDGIMPGLMRDAMAQRGDGPDVLDTAHEEERGRVPPRPYRVSS